MLIPEEYIEQAYFFRTLGERLKENLPIQDLLSSIREEVLSTTKLPLAIDFLLSELRHCGVIGTAMQQLPHYFTAFQTYIVNEAENEKGRFDMRIGLEILRREAEYRASGATPQGIFLFQFETLCRNRLRYSPGLDAMSEDPIFDEDWRQWVKTVRQQIGVVDIADMIYVRSAYYQKKRTQQNRSESDPERPILFGEGEGRISLANRQKDPLLLFSALQRHLVYPKVPRPLPADDTPQLIPQLMRRVERLETRIKLLEDEQRGGIHLPDFFEPPPPSSSKD